MPRQIASYLNLPDVNRYTGTDCSHFTQENIKLFVIIYSNFMILVLEGHAFRRTSASVLVNTGEADLNRLKKHGGWKSDTVAQGHVDESLAFKKRTANIIESAMKSTGRISRSVKIHSLMQV